MNEIKAVIFDMDGVLIDSEVSFLKIFPIICYNEGFNITDQHMKDILGTSYEYTGEYFYNIFGNSFPYEFLCIKVQEKLVDMAYNNKLSLKPYVVETLKYLKQKKYKISLGSSNNNYSVYNFIKAFNIESYFDAIVTGDDVKFSKPNPDIFNQCANKLNIKNENCVVIEDSLNGLKAAKSANMRSIMIPDTLPYDDAFKEYVDYKYNNLSEVNEIL